MMDKKQKTRITFALVSKTLVNVYFDRKHVGHIYSEDGDGGLPYPHEEKNPRCKTSMQICGFDRCSEVWSCGVFHGKKDLVVGFQDTSGEFMDQQKEEYKRYIQEFIGGETSHREIKVFLGLVWTHEPPKHRYVE